MPANVRPGPTVKKTAPDRGERPDDQSLEHFLVEVGQSPEVQACLPEPVFAELRQVRGLILALGHQVHDDFFPANCETGGAGLALLAACEHVAVRARSPRCWDPTSPASRRYLSRRSAIKARQSANCSADARDAR